MKSPRLKRIIWAVDAMEPREFQKSAELVIKGLTQGSKGEIYPVHVLCFPFEKSGEEAVPSNYEQAYLALAEKRLSELAHSFESPHLQKPRIFVDYKGSIRTSVEMLLDFALSKKADAIVVSTHSHGAVSKFFLGSFAETLLLQSDIPVITVNPQTHVRKSISRVLFPTSFQKRFRGGFEAAIELCASLGADLTLFYKETFVPAVKFSPELLKFLDEESVSRLHEINRCHEWARQHKVKLNIHEDTLPGNVAEAIQNFASQTKFDLIAMVSQTDDFKGPRVGSVCRKVVRNAHVPVWTFKTSDYQLEKD